MDLEQLACARLVVARLGEPDLNRWWRTDELLGGGGEYVGPRVLPRTHRAARARIAMAVTRHACLERHPAPNARTLFSLDADLEDRLDALLVERLGDERLWQPFFERLAALEHEADAGAVLEDEGVVQPADLRYVEQLSLGPAGRSLAVEPGASDAETLRRLAAGFVRATPGALVVPYVEAG